MENINNYLVYYIETELIINELDHLYQQCIDNNWSDEKFTLLKYISNKLQKNKHSFHIQIFKHLLHKISNTSSDYNIRQFFFQLFLLFPTKNLINLSMDIDNILFNELLLMYFYNQDDFQAFNYIWSGDKYNVSNHIFYYIYLYALHPSSPNYLYTMLNDVFEEYSTNITQKSTKLLFYIYYICHLLKNEYKIVFKDRLSMFDNVISSFDFNKILNSPYLKKIAKPFMKIDDFFNTQYFILIQGDKSLNENTCFNTPQSKHIPIESIIETLYLCGIDSDTEYIIDTGINSDTDSDTDSDI